MKKHFFVGLLVGILLASSFPVYGAVSSTIGKTVQAEHVVIVNGKELDVKAVNIDGTTYAPNRAIAEALETEIRFEDGKVIFESTEGDPNLNIQTEQENAPQISEPSEIELINKRLLEISKAEGEYIGERARLTADWTRNEDKRAEIEVETKELDDAMQELLKERDYLEGRKRELEQTP